MKTVSLWVGLACCGGALAQAQGRDPFDANVAVSYAGSNAVVAVRLVVPPRYHLYADTVRVEGNDGLVLVPLKVGRPVSLVDAFSNRSRDAYTNDVELTFAVEGQASSNATLTVRYQGCSEETCFFPKALRLPVYGAGGVPVPQDPDQIARTGTDSADLLLGRFQVAGRTSGYLRKVEFLDLLDSGGGLSHAPARPRDNLAARSKEALALFASDPVEFSKQFGGSWTLLLIVLGGLLLNVTPCVLPMIPVNLAIIGAGTQGAGRARGFLLGGVYGLGIAAVYGGLGVIVVLTGSPFGTLNSKPLFNAAIAVVFALMGLAMFDLFSIDLSRFQSNIGLSGSVRKGSVTAAFVMGGIAALLAGACVAPVVIAVLVLAGNLYSRGIASGILLPFVLGLGMALPWPLAGAGLSFLPKPGRWMNGVKYAFGVFVLLLAVYYAFVAYQGWRGGGRSEGRAEPGIFRVSASDGLEAWRPALAAAGMEGKPLFVDFWATWCKNCEAMDATTFRAKAVRARLHGFVVVRCQAEEADAPATRAVLERFDVKGLPTYLVLRSKGAAGEAR